MRDIIFVISTGRCGTRWLARELVKELENATVFHEADPVCTIEGYSSQIWDSKKDCIIRSFESSRKFYVETNHMFVKTFMDDAIKDFGDRIKVIILERDIEEVAKSLIKINMIPGRSRGARRWYLDPEADDNLVALPEDNDLVRCLWYCYEIKARAEKFVIDNSSIPIFRAKLKNLKEPSEFKKLLKWIDKDFFLISINPGKQIDFSSEPCNSSHLTIDAKGDIFKRGMKLFTENADGK